MRSILVPAVVLLTACGSGHSPATEGNGADTLASKDLMFIYDDEYIQVDPISRLEFEKHRAFDPKKDYDNSKLVDKQNDSLKLMPRSGEAVIFTDTLLKSDNEFIRFNAHLGDLLDYHVVETDYYEWAEWTLVRKSNGSKHVLISAPQLSPGKKYITSFTGYGITDPVYQLWEVSASGLQKKFELQSADKGFSIEEVRWVSDQQQAVKISWGAEREVYGMLTIK